MTVMKQASKASSKGRAGRQEKRGSWRRFEVRSALGMAWGGWAWGGEEREREGEENE